MPRAKLLTLELGPRETKHVTGWLCRDSNGFVAIWLGKRADIELDDGYVRGWHQKHSSYVADRDSKHASWLEVDGDDGWNTKPFCKKWPCNATDLPDSGKCKRVKIAVPEGG